MSAREALHGRRSGTEARREDWLDFESDFLAVHVLTEDGIIAATNRAFNEMFGGSQAAFIGRHQAALNNHSVAANLRLLQDIKHEINTSGSWRGFLVNRNPRGGEFTSRAHIYPMRDSGVRRYVCFQQPERGTAPPARPPVLERASAHDLQRA